MRFHDEKNKVSELIFSLKIYYFLTKKMNHAIDIFRMKHEILSCKKDISTHGHTFVQVYEGNLKRSIAGIETSSDPQASDCNISSSQKSERWKDIQAWDPKMTFWSQYNSGCIWTTLKFYFLYRINSVSNIFLDTTPGLSTNLCVRLKKGLCVDKAWLK